MVIKSDTGINEFKELRLQRIAVPDDFTAKVMDRIAREEAGGLSAMPSKMRVLVISLLFLIYGSTGILIGVQSWKSISQSSTIQNSKETFIKDFVQVHHLNSVSEIDKIFRPVK
jgi:hypothetical protein